MQTLSEHISTLLANEHIVVPDHITQNLNTKFELRPYQNEAFKRFCYASNHNIGDKNQYLFHMATGSGKTIIMAGCILHLYKLGYRNFIFFVNNSTIIEKTKNNFLNNKSSKYLFNNRVRINNTVININEVNNFEGVNNHDINIVFSTIQGLHTHLNNPQENSITYEDFEDKKIVLISDESHHINAATKSGKLTKLELEDINSWEATVKNIVNKNTDNKLLEFTATADLHHPLIREKYQNKLLFDYSLQQFRNDGYSKEVKVLQAELSPFQRALQAIIISQYRQKIFEKNGIIIKPVVLFKSKTIKESQEFYEEFTDTLKTLHSDDVTNIKSNNVNNIISTAFEYFKTNNISIDNLISELKEDFSANKCVSVDSKSDSEEKQLIINSLEDKDNEYRAIFAVDKLNEGWDVLNLFDIVRLYNPPSKYKKGKISKTTISEAQLIGRGARYYPFQLNADQPYDQRKYDHDITNSLRIGEELYYHAAYNPNYITEINTALVYLGLKDKPSIANKANYKRSIKQPKIRDKKHLNMLPISIKDKKRSYTIAPQTIEVSSIFGNKSNAVSDVTIKTCNISDIPTNIIHKAMNKLSFYSFDSLEKYFPKVKSRQEFITSKNYLSGIIFNIIGSDIDYSNLSPSKQIDIAIWLLEEIQNDIKQII